MADDLRHGHILENVVFGVAEGQEILNIFHTRIVVQNEGVPDVTIEEIAADLRAKWRLAVPPTLSVAYMAINYQVTAYDARQGGQPQPPTPISVRLGQRAVAVGGLAADTGVAVGDYSPTFVAAGFIKRTRQAGRLGRGAIRVGPLADIQTAGNLVDPAILDNLNVGIMSNLFNLHFISTSPTTQVEGVVFNRTFFLEDPQQLPLPDTYYQKITSLESRPFASSQVSRKRGKTAGA